MQNRIRIIGGQWRGRKLEVLNLPNLRPTPDRVRETLFNWLQNIIVGANCLDPFAGTGALGFEALSRGASFVTLVDQSRDVILNLREQAQVFQADNVDIYQGSSPGGLHAPQHKFNLVFLDPPFNENLLLPTCHFLEKNDYLANECYIYLEAKETLRADQLPENWEIIKNKKAGQVAYHLALRIGTNHEK